jgi:galactose mutarotase-like enzyme
LEEHSLSSEHLELTVLPDLGARIHRLRAFGHDVLRTPDDPQRHVDEPFFWGAYVMAPWGGRIDSHPTAVFDQVVDVPANFPDGTAIHGQVYSVPWREDLEGWVADGGGDGWPWRYLVTCKYGLLGSSLRIHQMIQQVTSRDDDASRMPAGLGIHPWFRRPVRVQISAGQVFESNIDSAPQPVAVDGLPYDARGEDGLRDGLDATWTDLGSPPVTFTWPSLGIGATMSMVSNSGTFVVAASPADLDAVAVEPQTHAPQGLRRLLNGEPGALMPISSRLSLTTTLNFYELPEEKQ